ncbi:mitochondrial ribosomal protein S6 [Brevipalpus obovatus]|uniref:mitochondrial ribosomal protein S6 n=1 Tax=Brevipalpus obovatus TaxID=246614 RepID=UPI003D9F7A48
MAPYEMFLSVARLPKDELVSLLKRMGTILLDNHAILRKIEYLGTKQFLKPVRKKGIKRCEPGETSGSFFVFHVDLPPTAKYELHPQLYLEKDVLRLSFERKMSLLPDGYTCQLTQEMLPPSQRPSVKRLIESGRRITHHQPFNPGTEGQRWPDNTNPRVNPRVESENYS